MCAALSRAGENHETVARLERGLTLLFFSGNWRPE